MRIIKSLDELEKDITKYNVKSSNLYIGEEIETNSNMYMKNGEPVLSFSSNYPSGIKWAISTLINHDAKLNNLCLDDKDNIASISITTTSKLITYKSTKRSNKSQSFCFSY